MQQEWTKGDVVGVEESSRKKEKGKEMKRRLNRRRGQREREVEWGNKERKKKRGQEIKRRGKEME